MKSKVYVLKTYIFLFRYFWSTGQAPQNFFAKVKWCFGECVKSFKTLKEATEIVVTKSSEIINDDNDEIYANCYRHYPGGKALFINCYECRYEYREDEDETESDEDD